ncbi:MAG: hypothetical protein DHS20C01_24800 [marine bacterium B5-7]|nr:MAG: hypothetical protein DHS20C01_24800 [marine bacterium B5-7]
MNYKKVCSALAISLTALLPFFIWWKGLDSTWIVAILFAVGALRLAGARSGFVVLQGVIAIFFAVLIAIGSNRTTLYYPVFVNLALLIIWFYSWVQPPTVIERLAPPEDIAVSHKQRYMRRLTLVWCGIFLVNLILSLLTALHGNLTLWIWWNGLGAYLFVGGFAAGEFLYRRVRMKKAVHEINP